MSKSVGVRQRNVLCPDCKQTRFIFCNSDIKQCIKCHGISLRKPKIINKPCLCGCGELPKKAGSIYCHGHNPKGEGFIKQQKSEGRKKFNHTTEMIEHLRKINTGPLNPNYIDGFTKNKKCPNCKKRISPQSDYCQSCAQKGERSFWFGKIGKNAAAFKEKSILKIEFHIRNCKKYDKWHTKILKRDNYTCQECNAKNGNGKKIFLEVHHIKPFYRIIDEFLEKYNEFCQFENKHILQKLAMKYEPFWDITNGKTLCATCHDKYNGKWNKK